MQAVQLTQYGSHQNTVVTPASPLTQVFTQQATSPRPDLGAYLTTSNRNALNHDTQLYHGQHTAASPQGPFGHGMPQVS